MCICYKQFYFNIYLSILYCKSVYKVQILTGTICILKKKKKHLEDNQINILESVLKFCNSKEGSLKILKFVM